MNWRLSKIVILGLSMFAATGARADYILTPLSGGNSSRDVTPGSSFALDLALTSNASDFHYAGVFTVEFSEPGLQYNSHAWGAPYSTTSGDNKSKPANSALPVLLSTSSYVAGSLDPNKIDVYFENFVPDPNVFTIGTVVSMNLTVPSGFPSGLVTITAVPDPIDAFDNGAAIPTTGGSFTLNVVPEPTSLTLLIAGSAAVAGLLAWRRPRRRPDRRDA